MQSFRSTPLIVCFYGFSKRLNGICEWVVLIVWRSTQEGGEGGVWKMFLLKEWNLKDFHEAI